VSVKVKIAGSQLAPGDRQYWGHEATVVEDAVSPNLADTFGGVGSVSVNTDVLDNTLLSQGTPLEVTFEGSGTRTARVQTVQATNDATATVFGDTSLARLNRTIRASVITTNLGAALRHYFGKCGLTAAQYSIDSSIAARSCILPGWEGNAWEMLKELQQIERFDIQDVSGIVTVKPFGEHTLDLGNIGNVTESLAENVQGRYVETHFYTYSQISNKIVYPPAEYDPERGGTTPAGWRTDAEIIEVTPGTPVTVEVEVMASLTSVKQPQPKTLVGPTYVSDSVYTVVTNDGVQAINPATWTKFGGKVTVEILPDTRTLRIVVDAGRNNMDLAPYRLALTAGSGSDYSTLRIVGTGVAIEKRKLRQRTTVPDSATDNDLASSTDSMFCRTESQAMRALRAQAHAASRSIGGLQAALPSVGNVFGQRAGAIVKRPDCAYRVRTVTSTVGGITLQADRYTTAADFNAVWAGKTAAEFNEIWAGYKARQFAAKPLRTSLPVAPVPDTFVGYGEGGYGDGYYGGSA
jgi:hypothetical protein